MSPSAAASERFVTAADVARGGVAGLRSTGVVG